MVESRRDTIVLSNIEKAILIALTHEFLTIKQIAIRRKCSVQAIYKIRKKLGDKGLLNARLNEARVPQETKVEKSQWANPMPPSNYVSHGKKIRLHAQEFNIKILEKDNRYELIRNKSNLLNIDGNTIRLYSDSIEIYSHSFFIAEDAQKATSQSFEYWDRIFQKLENDLKIIIIKSRYQNIKQVKAEYAEIENGLAKQCNINQEKIKVFTRDDGKLWFLIDNSFNLNEAETVHPQTSKQDMQEVVAPFFNDLRNNPVTMNDIKKAILELTSINKETASGLSAIVTYLKSQLPSEEKENLPERPDYVG